MSRRQMAELGALVGVLRAAGEGTRLRLLALLADGEHTVKDLTEILGQSQPRISRHLKLLADSRLIDRHAEGAWAYYRLAQGEAAELVHWLIARLDPADPDRARDRARLDWVRANQQKQAAAYFAKVAESWDVLRKLHVPDAAVEAAILEALGARQVDFLLDLGTGTGRMLELLAPHYRRGIGIDSSREMLAVARAKLAASGIAHAQVRLGDISNLDAALGRADLIVIHQVLHYFDDPGRLLAEIRPSLKPSGEMLIVDFAPHELEFLRTHHAHRRLGLSEMQMAEWAHAAGLAVASFKTLPPADDAGLTVCLWRLVAGPEGNAE
ncbi:MAG TPA: metalloregulator ArsR/SmtB family transcription factor [Devosiaceae bacterium]|nr:metalloregulator ArsR/SmtB family transcription factor [Devosiaceae bacterium]